MESSSSCNNNNTIAIESFSQSWLVNPSLVDNNKFYKELSDYQKVLTRSSRRSLSHSGMEDILSSSNRNFNFDVPFIETAYTLNHADQLFSDGIIKPASFVNSEFRSTNKESKYSTTETSTSNTTTTVDFVFPSSSRNRDQLVHVRFQFIGRLRKSSRRIAHKCFRYLWTLCYGVSRGSRKSNRVDDIDTRARREVMSWSNSPLLSPKRSTSSNTSAPTFDAYSYSINNWSYDTENSIYEAVLHCKRSIGK